MQGERVSGRAATWVSGVVGVWAGLAALGVIVAALISPYWALLREPIVITEAPRRLGLYSAGDPWAETDEGGDGGAPAMTQPSVVTTVTFRVGLWAACPTINNSHGLTPVLYPPCTILGYTWNHITHRHLHLPSPAPLAQTVIARMRLSTPFLVLACVFLTVGCLLAVVVRSCYHHAALLAALLFSLAGLSVGAGVVWFVSVVSEEYGAAYGRRTSWSAMYAYRYGWALMAAGGGSVCALLAALLTGHAYLARHGPLSELSGPGGGSGVLGRSTSGTEESLARPLLRCRSEGCLGQRSFTSDTIRTYLTCDSRRHHPRGGCPTPLGPPPASSSSSALPHSTSIVDLTRPQQHRLHELPPPPPPPLGQPEDASRDSSLHQSGTESLRPSRRPSRDTVLGEELPEDVLKPEWDTSRVIIEAPRISASSASCVMVVPPPPPLSPSSSSSPSSPSPADPPTPLPPPPLPTPVTLPPNIPPTTSSNTVPASSSSTVPIRSPLGGNTSSSTTSSSSSSSASASSRAHGALPEILSGVEGKRVSTLTRKGMAGLHDPLRPGGVSHEPLRLPEYNSFTTGDYSRTLPSLGRQMAVFERRAGGGGGQAGLQHHTRAATLSRSSSKISSEV